MGVFSRRMGLTLSRLARGCKQAGFPPPAGQGKVTDIDYFQGPCNADHHLHL